MRLPILRAPPSPSYTHDGPSPTHNPFRHFISPTTQTVPGSSPATQAARRKKGRRKGKEGREGWRVGGSRFGPKRPGAITCPDSTCSPSEGTSGPSCPLQPPGPHAIRSECEPLCPEKPHVGASGSHVSAPPAQVFGSVRPIPSSHREGALCSAGGGGGCPRPLPRCQVRGKSLGRGEACWSGSRGS